MSRLPYGSIDVQYYINCLHSRRAYTGHIFKDFQADEPVGDDAQAQFKANDSIVQHIASLIILARLLVFGLFLEVIEEVSSSWQSKYNLSAADIERRAQLAWVLLQACPVIDPASGCIEAHANDPKGDIFGALVGKLWALDYDECAKEIAHAYGDIPERFRPELLCFDEVQAAESDLHTRRFDRFNRQPPPFDRHALLRPLVRGISQHVPTAQVLISGTTIDREHFDSALSSSSLAPEPPLQFWDLGGFSQEDDILVFLSHFFGRTFVSSWPKVVLSKVLHFLKGR